MIALSHFGINVTDVDREQILEETEAICRSRPGFMPRGDWRRVQVERIAVAN